MKPLANGTDLAEELTTRHPSVGFLLSLGKALHASGASAYRLEETLGGIALYLGIPLQVFSMPTGLFVAVGDLAHQVTILFRVEPASVNLERLALLYLLGQQVVEGGLTPEEGSLLIQDILKAPPRYGPWASTASYALFSAAVAVLFGGGWREVVAAAVIGLATGLLALIAERAVSVGRLFELLAALLAPIVAGLVDLVLGPIAGYLVIASGLIVLMPGLSLTTALNELATRHLSSGTARLAGAGVVFLALACGTALGKTIVGLMPGVVFITEPQVLPPWAQIPSVLVCGLCMLVLFQARPGDVGWVVGATAIATLGTDIGNRLLDTRLAGFVAALAVGVVGNLYGRLRRQPSATFLIPGITMLVPGSVGYRSLSSLLEGDVLSGVSTAFAMTLIAISLVAGLLFANLLASAVAMQPSPKR